VNNAELIKAIRQLEEEKGLSKDVLIEVVRELEQQLWMTRAQLPQGGGG